MKRKIYERPQTTLMCIEVENGFMGGSIFDEENQQDDGVSIEGHEVGNEATYENWDFQDPNIN